MTSHGRIHQDRDAGDRRDRFLQQLEAFSRELDVTELEARDVATGPRQCRDQALFHHVDTDAEDDGDRGGRLLDRLYGFGGVRPDDIRGQSNELGDEGREPRRLPRDVAVLEDDALSVDIAEVAQALQEATGARPGIVEDLWRAWVQHADPRKLPPGLRQRRQRRHDHAPREQDEHRHEAEHAHGSGASLRISSSSWRGL